jgi:hypothetical protein
MIDVDAESVDLDGRVEHLSQHQTINSILVNREESMKMKMKNESRSKFEIVNDIKIEKRLMLKMKMKKKMKNENRSKFEIVNDIEIEKRLMYFYDNYFIFFFFFFCFSSRDD